eukprot:116236-Prymnesium_polylepis.1
MSDCTCAHTGAPVHARVAIHSAASKPAAPVAHSQLASRDLELVLEVVHGHFDQLRILGGERQLLDARLVRRRLRTPLALGGELLLAPLLLGAPYLHSARLERLPPRLPLCLARHLERAAQRRTGLLLEPRRLVIVHGKGDAGAVLVALHTTAVIDAPPDRVQPLDGCAGRWQRVVPLAHLGGDLAGAQLAVRPEPLCRVVLGRVGHRGKSCGEQALDERVALCLLADALHVEAPPCTARRLRSRRHSQSVAAEVESRAAVDDAGRRSCRSLEVLERRRPDDGQHVQHVLLCTWLHRTQQRPKDRVADDRHRTHCRHARLRAAAGEDGLAELAAARRLQSLLLL